MFSWMEANSGLSWDNWMEQQHRKKDFQGHCLLWKHFYMSPEGWASSDVLPASVRHGIDERYPMGRCAFPYFWIPRATPLTKRTAMCSIGWQRRRQSLPAKGSDILKSSIVFA